MARKFDVTNSSRAPQSCPTSKRFCTLKTLLTVLWILNSFKRGSFCNWEPIISRMRWNADPPSRSQILAPPEWHSYLIDSLDVFCHLVQNRSGIVVAIYVRPWRHASSLCATSQSFCRHHFSILLHKPDIIFWLPFFFYDSWPCLKNRFKSDVQKFLCPATSAFQNRYISFMAARL